MKAKLGWWFAAAALIWALGQLVWTRFGQAMGNQVVSFVPANKACSELGALSYCVFTAHSGTSDDIVYHLHGRNLDATVWNDDSYFTALIQDQWQRHNVRPPRVVTVSYGGTWLLAPKGQLPASGLLEQFVAHIDQIESKIGKPAQRMLLGESMGGLNVLIAGLRYPERFAKVAALCPGVYADSPFAPLKSIHAAVIRTGASPKTALAVYRMAHQHFSSEEEWRAASPLHLIERAHARYPSLYLSCGLYDHFGNFEGTEQLARAAKAKGISVQWQPLYGGHCASDATSVAQFLANPVGASHR